MGTRARKESRQAERQQQQQEVGQYNARQPPVHSLPNFYSLLVGPRGWVCLVFVVVLVGAYFVLI